MILSSKVAKRPITSASWMGRPVISLTTASLVIENNPHIPPTTTTVNQKSTPNGHTRQKLRVNRHIRHTPKRVLNVRLRLHVAKPLTLNVPSQLLPNVTVRISDPKFNDARRKCHRGTTESFGLGLIIIITCGG